MSYLILTNGGVLEFAELSELDRLSVVIATVCHDIGHDGMNNAYHVNAGSERAIQFNDQAV